MRTLLSLIAAVFAFSASQVAFSQAVPRVVFPTTTIGNVINLGPLTASAANASNFSFGAAANGSVFANSSAALPTSGGASVAINVAGSVAKPSLLAALGRFAVKVLPLLNTASALYDLGKELGYVSKINPDGSASLSTSVPVTACGAISASVQTSANNACKGNGFASGAAVPGRVISSTQCNVNYQCSGPSYTMLDVYSVGATTTNVLTPVTAANIQTAVEAKMISGGLTPPVQAIFSRLIPQIINSGESLDVVPTAVTGPASQQLSQTVTANGASRQTTTETVSQNYTYGPSSVAVTNSTTVSTVGNAPGSIPSQSTSVSTVAQPSNQGVVPVVAPVAPSATAPVPAAITCGLPGTPACKIDEAGTPVYDQKKLDLDKPTLDAASLAQRSTIQGSGDKTMFSGFSKFFTLPALHACEPVVMPRYAGVQMASMDVCPGAEWLRGLMGFVWAVAGFAFCFKTVEGVI